MIFDALEEKPSIKKYTHNLGCTRHVTLYYKNVVTYLDAVYKFLDVVSLGNYVPIDLIHDPCINYKTTLGEWLEGCVAFEADAIYKEIRDLLCHVPDVIRFHGALENYYSGHWRPLAEEGALVLALLQELEK